MTMSINVNASTGLVLIIQYSRKAVRHNALWPQQDADLVARLNMRNRPVSHFFYNGNLGKYCYQEVVDMKNQFFGTANHWFFAGIGDRDASQGVVPHHDFSDAASRPSGAGPVAWTSRMQNA